MKTLAVLFMTLMLIALLITDFGNTLWVLIVITGIGGVSLGLEKLDKAFKGITN